jgi:hypothetical protein
MKPKPIGRWGWKATGLGRDSQFAWMWAPGFSGAGLTSPKMEVKQGLLIMYQGE